MILTSDQFARHVLGYVGVIASGQDVTIEDATVVQSGIDMCLAWANGAGIISAIDIDAVPDPAVEPFARLVAVVIGPRYGVPQSQKARDDAERDMRRSTAVSAFFTPSQTDMF